MAELQKPCDPGAKRFYASLVMSAVCSTGYGFVVPFMLSSIHSPTMYSVGSWSLREGGSVWFLSILWVIGSFAAISAGFLTFRFVFPSNDRITETLVQLMFSAFVVVVCVVSRDVPLWPRVFGCALPVLLFSKFLSELLGIAAMHNDSTREDRHRRRTQSEDDRIHAIGAGWVLIAFGCLCFVAPFAMVVGPLYIKFTQ